MYRKIESADTFPIISPVRCEHCHSIRSGVMSMMLMTTLCECSNANGTFRPNSEPFYVVELPNMPCLTCLDDDSPDPCQ